MNETCSARTCTVCSQTLWRVEALWLVRGLSHSHTHFSFLVSWHTSFCSSSHTYYTLCELKKKKISNRIFSTLWLRQAEGAFWDPVCSAGYHPSERPEHRSAVLPFPWFSLSLSWAWTRHWNANRARILTLTLRNILPDTVAGQYPFSGEWRPLVKMSSIPQEWNLVSSVHILFYLYPSKSAETVTDLLTKVTQGDIQSSRWCWVY